MKSPYSFRGLLIGTLLCMAVGVLAPYGVAFQFFLIGFNPSSPGAIFFFFALTLIVSLLVRLLGRHFALSRADLVLIYCMLLMAVTMPTWGLGFFLIGTIVYPYYYATAENRFAELFHDLIPSWMTPQDLVAIRDYYEGLPKGAAIPWEAWVEPMAYWFALILAIGLMLITLSAILHRQWSVHERLAYPMAQLPQSMIDGMPGTDSPVKPFLRNRLVWLGFALPMVFFSKTGCTNSIPPCRNSSSSGSVCGGSATRSGCRSRSASPGSGFSTWPAWKSPSASGSSTSCASWKRVCFESSGSPAPRSSACMNTRNRQT